MCNGHKVKYFVEYFGIYYQYFVYSYILWISITRFKEVFKMNKSML